MNLITITDPRSPMSEAYRTLRTNLSFYSLDNPIRSLVISSPADDDGKSTLVANLGVTMAQSGRKTVLVDCDLRRPSLHEFFSLKSEPGLTNKLLDEVDELPLQQSEIENLWILSSGKKPPNPADMLGTKKIDEIISYLSEQFDIVLYDAPPVLAVTDAAVLGVKLDGALLVIRAGKTRRDHAEQAKERLEKASVRVIGAALTNAPRDGALGGYYG